MKRLVGVIAAGVAMALAVAASGCAKRAVAKVNGEAITEQEFYQRLQEAAGQQVLDRLILQVLVEQKAREKKVEVTDQEVDAILTGFKDEAGEQWQQFLSMRGLTEQDVKRSLRDNLLIAKLMFSDQEIKEYWEQNRTRFDQPATVTYRRVIADTKEQANKARQDLVSGKLEFDQAVEEFSKNDPFAVQGGRIGPAPEAAIEPEVRQVVFTIAPGEVSEPIEAPAPMMMVGPDAKPAYWLVQVEKRTEGKQVSFEEASPKVIQALMETRGQEIQEYLSELRAAANVSILEDRYRSLAEEYAKAKERRPPPIPAPRPTTEPEPPSPEQGE